MTKSQHHISLSLVLSGLFAETVINCNQSYEVCVALCQKKKKQQPMDLVIKSSVQYMFKSFKQISKQIECDLLLLLLVITS